MSNMSEQAEQRAYAYFQSGGFHCAESISKAIVELHAAQPSAEIPRVASAFAGGIGGTHADVCGALTGGVIAIGYLYGRTEPGQDIRVAKELAAEFRRRFVQTFGSSNCQTLTETLAHRTDGFTCQRLTGQAAGLLAELLAEHPPQAETGR